VQQAADRAQYLSDIGDNVRRLVLSSGCKGGKGQFSVAGPHRHRLSRARLEDRPCPPAQGPGPMNELLAALTEATTWRRQGDDRLLQRQQDVAVSTFNHELSSFFSPRPACGA